MTKTTVQTQEQLPANLTALHRQLEELARQTKQAGTKAEQPQEICGPVLVIRGK